MVVYSPIDFMANVSIDGAFIFFFFVVQVNQKAEPICPQLIQLWDLCAVNPCSPMPNVMLTASLCSHSKVLQTSGNSHSGHPI